MKDGTNVTSTNRLDHHVRASCVFQLSDEKGNKEDYLGLFDTGTTASLISQELVDKYKMSMSTDNGRWNTNTGLFKTNKKANILNMKLPRFSNKREIRNTVTVVNPNGSQKYKAIFGIDFLLKNRIDFIFSRGGIERQGISIPLSKVIEGEQLQ